MNKIRNYWKNKKGITLVWGAFFLILCLMFLGMAADIAYMYVVKNQLQVAADAAALAGAAKLDGSDSVDQEAAREKAWEVACENTAAGSNVYLVTDNSDQSDTVSCNDIPNYTNLNIGNNNTVDDDIVVGHWDGSSFSPALQPGQIFNAVQVRARRTEGSPGGPASLFIGKVFGWSLMNARASAIAASRPGPSAPLVICENACGGVALPHLFQFNEQTEGSPYGIAWTRFDQSSDITAQSCLSQTNNCNSGFESTCDTDIHKRVAAFIWHRRTPSATCVPISWDNTGGAGTRFDLNCAFESTTFDSDNKTDAAGNTPPEGPVATWRVIVPVSQSPAGCPAGNTPGQRPYPITQLAEMVITDVIVPPAQGTPHGVIVSSLNCFPCGDWTHLGSRPVLVK